jgi:acyl carrier protein
MKLEQLFASVLHEPVDQLSDQSSPKNLRSWDSLRHIELVLAAESVYGVQFSTGEVATIRSMGCLRDLLVKKGVAF